MWPVVGAVVGGAAIYEIGKDLGWWGDTTIPPPGVLPGGQPVMTGIPSKDMNAMLKWTGYRMVDQPIYKQFQASVAGLTVDGFPGAHTMAALKQVLAASGEAIAPVPVYPWLSAPSAGGYNGINAPTMAEWGRGAPVSHAAAPPLPQTDAGGEPASNETGLTADIDAIGGGIIGALKSTTGAGDGS